MKANNKGNLKHQRLSLKNLVNISEWQKIQDNFSAVTSAGIQTVDLEGNQLTSPSREPRLCSELLKNYPLKEKFCGPCLPTFLGGLGVVDKNLRMICNAGLCNFITPLRIDEDKVLGYIILGPLILVMRKTKEEYRAVAEELDVDLEEFWDALLEIKVISMEGAHSVVDLIKDVAEYTLKLSYQNITLQRRRKEMIMAADSPKLSKLLEALLDVAFQITGAEIGSIMFFEKDQKDEMTVRASRGLPEEIVSKARVRLGNGISGIAAQERKSILIDDNLRDNRIRSYLTRPYISSSMVLPIEVKDRVLGVMNLGALQTSAVRFNTDNVQLMHKLIELATVALHE